MKTRILFLAFLILSACTHKVKEAPQVFITKSDRVVIDQSSNLLHHLEILSLGSYESRQVGYQSVGKLIALSNASNELTGSKTVWAELDPAVTKAAQLHLASEAVGVAYGVTSISTELVDQIKTGQMVHIKHYRVVETGWTAAIVKIVNTADPATKDVVFRVSSGRDLYPGTTCEVMFPLLQARAVKVPATALVHQGLDEYVWQEVATNEFSPRKVTPVEGSSDEVILSSGISEKTKIVGRGAILLKPQIKAIMNFKGGSGANEVNSSSP